MSTPRRRKAAWEGREESIAGGGDPSPFFGVALACALVFFAAGLFFLFSFLLALIMSWGRQPTRTQGANRESVRASARATGWGEEGEMGWRQLTSRDVLIIFSGSMVAGSEGGSGERFL